mmetsp:Transcript_110200/g.322500  ORF Transcript_110200/g.322500 Transcript_110200/m.322500 type:complete len:236 (-) Transcript_110200:28-735(-)
MPSTHNGDELAGETSRFRPRMHVYGLCVWHHCVLCSMDQAKRRLLGKLAIDGMAVVPRSSHAAIGLPGLVDALTEGEIAELARDWHHCAQLCFFTVRVVIAHVKHGHGAGGTASDSKPACVQAPLTSFAADKVNSRIAIIHGIVDVAIAEIARAAILFDAPVCPGEAVVDARCNKATLRQCFGEQGLRPGITFHKRASVDDHHGRPHARCHAVCFRRGVNIHGQRFLSAQTRVEG